MGVELTGPSYIYGDNMSVIHNTQNPESTLKKKSNSIAYHYVRSRCAADILRIEWINTKDQLADILTKVHTGEVRKRLANMIMWDDDELETIKLG